MTTTLHTHPPTRLLAAFFTRKMQRLVPLFDEGGLFECRFLLALIDRERAGVIAGSAEAASLETKLTQLRTQVKADLAAADDTPGEIDPHEAKRLLRLLTQLNREASQHHAHLEKLV